jgi:hypothetical protein
VASPGGMANLTPAFIPPPPPLPTPKPTPTPSPAVTTVTATPGVQPKWIPPPPPLPTVTTKPPGLPGPPPAAFAAAKPRDTGAGCCDCGGGGARVDEGPVRVSVPLAKEGESHRVSF